MWTLYRLEKKESFLQYFFWHKVGPQFVKDLDIAKITEIKSKKPNTSAAAYTYTRHRFVM